MTLTVLARGWECGDAGACNEHALSLVGEQNETLSRDDPRARGSPCPYSHRIMNIYITVIALLYILNTILQITCHVLSFRLQLPLRVPGLIRVSFTGFGCDMCLD